MAKNKNREPVKAVEPEYGSSDEETDAEEEPQATPEANTTLTNKPEEEPEEESDEEEGSESDSDPKPSNPIPITSVPPLTPSKRLAADAAKKSDPKKPKIDSVSNNNKVLFQRVFNDDDEIVILKGMIDFETKNNVSPIADMDAFVEFIKNKLHVDVSKRQLQGKIRKLRSRFENNKGKYKKDSAKPHDKALFELSEKIWGGGEKTMNVVKKKGKTTEDGKNEAAVEVSDGVVEKNALVGKSGSSFGLSCEEKLLRIGAELFGGEEKIVGSDEWSKLEKEEMVLSLKMLDVRRAKMKLVLDAME